MNMSLSHFDDPGLTPETTPGVRLSGRLDDFVPGTPVRLRITITQATTDAITKIDKIVIAPKFTVTDEEFSTGQVQGSEFDGSSVVATAQASVQWGKELTL